MHRARSLALAAGVAALLLFPVLGLGGTPARPGEPATYAPLDVLSPVASTPTPFTTGMAASAALGVPNLTGRYLSLAPNATDFVRLPEYAFADPQGDVWVTDLGGARVLEFPAPIRTGEAAALVLGQSDFGGTAPGTTAANLSSPAAATMDAAGDLWVSDWGNNRILEYVPPFHTGMTASLVLGQTNFTGHGTGDTPSTLDRPVGLAFDPNGRLWVADRGNNRVLAYVPPFESGMPASVALGQSNLTSGAPGSAPTNLSYPIDVTVSGPTLWVADELDNRVVGYTAPWTTGEPASLLLGQASFGNTNATGPASLATPLSVTVDAQGTLWISDAGHNRVVGFRPPYSTFEAPSIALGQSSLNGTHGGIGPSNLTYPVGAVVGANGTLWVTDAGNDRLVEYVPTGYPVSVSEQGLPPGTVWTVEIDRRTAAGSGILRFNLSNGTHTLYARPVPGYVANPSLEAVTVAGTAAQLAVTYEAVAPNPFSSGSPASLVLGQPDPFSSEPALPGGLTASEFGGGAYAVAFDSAGNLWVADRGGNRVLEFRPLFGNGMAAATVLGQTTFAGRGAGTSPSNLSSPDGLAFDAQGDLWVADSGNNRVVEFLPPFSSGMSAAAALGQPDLTGSGPGDSAAQLRDPSGLAFVGAMLWASDAGNNRVVGYPLPLSAGESATVALGQRTLTGGAAGTSTVNLSDPTGLASGAAGALWVADTGNSRIVEYPTPLSTDPAAALVLGQTNFNQSIYGGPSGLAAPQGVAVDPRGDVWVADTGQNRTVEFLGSTLVDGQAPSIALGQGDISTMGAGAGPSGEDGPTGVLEAPGGTIWVGDVGNDRLLAYAPANFSVQMVVSGLPSASGWSATLAGSTRSGVSSNTTSWSETNGTYGWSLAPLSGYRFFPATGTVDVNGANVSVNVSAEALTYPVAFTARGIGPTEPWAVTFDGIVRAGTGAGPIVFVAANGSHRFAVDGPTGYAVSSNASGILEVVGTPVAVVVGFGPALPNSPAPPLVGEPLLLGLLAGAFVTAAVVLVVRRARHRPPVQSQDRHLRTAPTTPALSPTRDDRGPGSPPTQQGGGPPTDSIR